MTKTQRNLDGVYFRIERDGMWQNVCYSDMTSEERDSIDRMRAETSTPEEQKAWWRSMADIMADTLYSIGEQLDLVCE